MRTLLEKGAPLLTLIHKPGHIMLYIGRGAGPNAERAMMLHAIWGLRGRGPLELAFSAPVGGKSAALAVERWIKRLPRRRKELLVTGHLAWPGQA